MDSEIFSISFYSLLYFFFLYSFLGWCIETTYATITNHKFINRGFLYGPFCPMYGLCACLLVLLLDPIKNSNILFVFVYGVLITSAIEYFTGFALEKCFKKVWWDYSGDAFNLKGRISLLFSIIWGVLSVFFIKFAHPFFVNGLTAIHTKSGIVILNILLLYILIDLAMTLISLVKLNTLISELKSFYADFKIRIEAIKYSETGPSDNLEKFKIELREKYEKTIKKIRKNHSRLLSAFPQYTSKKIDYFVDDIKTRLETLNKH